MTASQLRVGVLGVGAVGTVYGALLASHADVLFVPRDIARAPTRLLAEHASVAIRREHTPRYEDRMPPVDVVLVAVRGEQLEIAAKQLTQLPSTTVVVFLGPVLPPTASRLRQLLGDRVSIAMPGVVAYQPETDASTTRHVRYWTPRVAPTLFDADSAGGRDVLVELAARLSHAGLPSAVRPGVAALNAATAVAFLPVVAGIAACRSMERLQQDEGLRRLGPRANKQALALARAMGPTPAFLSLLFSLSSPLLLRASLALARRKAPESIRYLEHHFGQKLPAQVFALLDDARELARTHHLSIDALEAIAAQIDR